MTPLKEVGDLLRVSIEEAEHVNLHGLVKGQWTQSIVSYIGLRSFTMSREVVLSRYMNSITEDLDRQHFPKEERPALRVVERGNTHHGQVPGRWPRSRTHQPAFRRWPDPNSVKATVRKQRGVFRHIERNPEHH